MKNFLIICALSLISLPAVAQHHGYRSHYYGHRYHSGSWVAPLVIGGVIGYAVTRNRETVIVQQPPVVVSPPVIAAGCGPWVETQQPDGTIVRQRTCTE